MHPLHDYIASQISERLKDRGVVVMYDKREELRPFFIELAGSAYVDGTLIPITIGKQNAKLYVFDGSFLKARFTVEEITNGDQPEQLVIYIPSLDRDTKGSLLMELEKAGTFYSQPALKQFARLVLRKRYTDVAIDDMLKSDNLTYADLARMAQDEAAAEGASLLKGVFGNSDTTAILTTWIADAEHDGDLEAKGALGELRSVVLARLGLTIPDDATNVRMRSITARYVLANEFRSDLGENGQLKGPAAAASRTLLRLRRRISKRRFGKSRSGSANVTPPPMQTLADGIESELGLSTESVVGSELGAIDTFRFEEMAVAATCFDLIAAEKFAEARTLIGSRDKQFLDQSGCRSQDHLGGLRAYGRPRTGGRSRLCNHREGQRKRSPMGGSLRVNWRWTAGSALIALREGLRPSWFQLKTRSTREPSPKSGVSMRTPFVG